MIEQSNNPPGGLKLPLRKSTKTLRDEFAMAALAGMLGSIGIADGFFYDQAAEEAYRFADAMLKERAKK